MAHLLKLIDINGNKLLGYPYTLNNNSMSCGDSYKNGKSHKFVGTKTQVEVLLEVIKRFKLPDIVLSDIEETSFVFSSNNLKQQVFVFRLCRYIRNEEMLNLLEKTIDLNSKNKLAIYNAFVLAHYIQSFQGNRLRPRYYASDMDLVYMNDNFLCFSFKSYKEFLNHLNDRGRYFHSLFYSDAGGYDNNIAQNRRLKPRSNELMRKEYTLFESYIKDKKYKKAINLIKDRV